MSSRDPLADLSFNESKKPLSAPQGASGSLKEDQMLRAMDQQYMRFRTMWTEGNRHAQLAESLQQQVAERDGVIAQLTTEVSAKDRLLVDQQSRLKKLESSLAEEKARSAKLLQFSATIQRLLANNPDVIGLPQTPAAAPLSPVVAVGENPMASVNGAPELEPAPPAPELSPSATLQVELEAEVDTQTPLPGRDGIPSSSSVAERVDTPAALSIGQSTHNEGSNSGAYHSILRTQLHGSNASHLSSAAAGRRASAEISRPKKVVPIAPRPDHGNGITFVGQHQRTTSGACQVFLLAHADEAVRPHKRAYPCGVDGCPKVYRSASARQRHATAKHFGRVLTTIS